VVPCAGTTVEFCAKSRGSGRSPASNDNSKYRLAHFKLEFISIFFITLIAAEDVPTDGGPA
jgi:hypothetical protein